MQLELGAASHVGAIRAVNEDACLATAHLAVVADGMGGHARGDIASQLAIDAFRTLGSRTDLTPDDIRNAASAANASIVTEGAERPERAGLGTTLAGLALVDYAGSKHWLLFNVGDSRVYRLAPTSATLLTHDHSEVQEMVDAGRISDAQARVHPLRNIVTRSLGSDPAADVDVWIFPPTADDAFLVCSDGLTNELSDAEIAVIAAGSATSGDAAARLVSAAVEAGGRDNVTAVVVRTVRDAAYVDDSDVTTGPRSIRLEVQR